MNLKRDRQKHLIEDTPLKLYYFNICQAKPAGDINKSDHNLYPIFQLVFVALKLPQCSLGGGICYYTSVYIVTMYVKIVTMMLTLSADIR